MPLKNRNLSAGTRLVATYKKQNYLCTVEASEEGERNEFVLEDGKRFRSPSAAGSSIMGGKAVNGWRFWSLEGEAQAEATEAPAKETTTKKPRRLIYRVPNQQGTPVGRTKFFCSACMNGFLVEEGKNPQVCPAGHRIDDPELTAP